MILVESSSLFNSLFEHDLFGKPLHTFPDHALGYCFDAFSSREPVSTSLENAIIQILGKRGAQLLPVDFADRFGATGLGHGKTDPVAGMQRIQRYSVLHFKLLGGPAGIRTDRSALDLPDGDRIIEPVNFGDHAQTRLFGRGD